MGPDKNTPTEPQHKVGEKIKAPLCSKAQSPPSPLEPTTAQSHRPPPPALLSPTMCDMARNLNANITPEWLTLDPEPPLNSFQAEYYHRVSR